jgi:cytochrome c oxidase cbb3-type subunit 3
VKARSRLWLAAAIAGLTLAGGGMAHLMSQAQMRARLMRMDPDAIPRDADLTAFATALARPAYGAHCAVCHGADLKGDRAKGAPNLTDDDWLYGEGRVAEIEQTVLYGIRAGNGKTRDQADMPAFARAVPYRRYAVISLQPNEIRDVVEFLFVAAGKAGDESSAARGSQIFLDKGQCFDCHEQDARGNNSIGAPNLLDDVWLSGNGTRPDLIDTVSRGASDFCPAWVQRLTPATIRALAVFIYAASHKSS